MRGYPEDVDGGTSTPAEIRDTVTALLSDHRAKAAAKQMQREITALPGPESALTLLELVARHSPKPGDETDGAIVEGLS